MRNKTMKKIEESQFRKTYLFMLNEVEHSGEMYLRALKTIFDINSILTGTRTNSDKEIIDIDIVNEIFFDVVDEVKKIGVDNYENDAKTKNGV